MISFVLPAYKRKYFRVALDSILAQSYRDFELIVVDDKSPEGLYEVIKEYPWERVGETLPDGGRKWNVDGISVRYYQNAKNIGGEDLVAAWNQAMGYATGEWCVLASDDDIYHPEYLREMLRLQAKYPECDLFHCRLAVINAEGKWLRVGEQRIEFESQVQMAYSRGIMSFWQTAQEYMFRRSALEDINGFVKFPLAWYSDDATWMLLSRRGCVCSSRILFFFRQSGENISSNIISSFERKARAADMFKKWFRGFSGSLKPLCEEDSFLMDGLADRVDYVVNERTKGIIARVESLKDWKAALRASLLSKAEKRSCMYRRWRWLLALRLLLPTIRR